MDSPFGRTQLITLILCAMLSILPFRTQSVDDPPPILHLICAPSHLTPRLQIHLLLSLPSAHAVRTKLLKFSTLFAIHLSPSFSAPSSFAWLTSLWASHIPHRRYFPNPLQFLTDYLTSPQTPQEHWPGKEDCLCSEECSHQNNLLHSGQGGKKITVLEIGAGLGAGGLGAAVVAKRLGARVDVIVTDFDPAACEIVRASMRSNGLVR